MGDHMLQELVKSKTVPVAFVMVGSLFMASCSSSVSRFDFPVFGLSNSGAQTRSVSSLSGGARLGQGGGDFASYPDGRAEKSAQADYDSGLASTGSSSLNTRSSYLPPQIAAPEVRSARYEVNDNRERSLDRSARGTYEGRGRAALDRSDQAPYNPAPMKPIIEKPVVEAHRSFLPSEPTGYKYNTDTVRSAIRRASARPVHKRLASRQPVRSVRSLATPRRGGDSVIVAPGDTLYSIGRRYNVPVMKLMEINNLSDSSLKVGQRILLPGGAGRPVPASHDTASAHHTPVAAVSSGTYTVRSGESFQSIAKKNGVTTAQLADINGITDTGAIRPGEVLILPTRRKSVSRHASLSHRAGIVRKKMVRSKTTSGSGKRKVTSVAKTSRRPGAIPHKARGQIAFRWPVRGRIIGKFGPRANGTNNDGINLAVPEGTKVKAAESGVVAYAGNELKGYGNLVLIRHSNGWVSAYAHNAKLLVKRGDKIRRGQVVARAGTTGSVAQPQLHFELRKGSKPVDPLKYMAGS